ncbi:MAG: putative unusual protein kinase regulating ubiquinone biosynthesis (AarF/ABC1/UbiB family), partial [Myxococcota bacterium]
TILGSYFLVLSVVTWRSRRRNAKMRTSIPARSAAVGRLIARSASRKMWLRLRQVVASRKRRTALKQAYQIKTSEEAAALMGQMKGVFMKLGQVASFAQPSLPKAAQKALAALQQDAPPMSFELARGVIEAELGGVLSDHFRDVDEVPLASASIGQVHRARLKDGTEVVLKVQYPGVADAIRSDLQFTHGIMSLFGGLFPNTDNKAMVGEVKARLLEEVDYRQELRNQLRFGEIWRGHPLIRIPAVFPEFSGERVLCQSYARGLSFYDFIAVANETEKQLAVCVLNDFVFDSMHLHSVFNGDPHPGNYLFHEDGGITFLDFGCVKRFEGTFLADVRALNRAIVDHDRDGFEMLIRRLKIILPGRKMDADFVWDFFQYHAEPFAEDRVFSFTPEYLARAGDVMKLSNLRKLNLPPDLVFFNRITFGLNAIFERLGAEANFHRWYRRYIDLSTEHPPALARVGVELEARFLTTQ